MVDLHDKIRKNMTGGLSIVFTRKAVLDQIHIRNSETILKLSWVLMPVNSIPFRCVKKRQMVFTNGGSSTTNSQIFEA